MTRPPLTACPRCGNRRTADESGLCAACLLLAGSETFASSSFDELPTMTSGGGAAAADHRRRPVPGETWGAYRIGSLLGRGGMGEVYEAEHMTSGRRVALKVLHGRLDRGDRARFLREGQLAASITHPHTVYIFGSDEIGGMPVITMELLPGGTLKDRVAAQGPLPVADAVAAVLDIIGGLDAAQAAGVLHRDIKPSNCFIEHDGTVKVGDFGLSISTLARDVHQHVSSQGFEGTPQFAPPEQLRGEPLDIRADIYAVGATLYYLLTGRPPFDGADLTQLFDRVMAGAPASPRVARSDVPSGLAAIVLRCLARRPSDRPSSYAELAEMLRPYGPHAHRPAPPGIRLVAGGIDAAVLAVPNAVLGAWGGAGSLLAALMVWVLSFSYYLALEGPTGASIGKRALGLRVVSATGSPASFVPLVIRTATFLIGTLAAALPVAIGLRPAGTGLSMSALPLLVLILLFVTIRRRNGWAAVHDLLSRTRVVTMRTEGGHRTVVRRERRFEIVTSAASQPARLGPFTVLGELESTATGRLLLGFDAQLRRQVWIHTVPPGTPEISAARRDVARSTRLRWLAGRRTTTEHWDGFEAPAGEPWLERTPGPMDWPTLRVWLSDLATELAAGERDASLPALALDRLWVRDDGQLVLLDYSAPGVDAGEAGHQEQSPVGLLAAVVAHAWPVQARQGSPSDLPLSARRLVDLLSRPALPSLDEIRARLAAAVSAPDRVRRWRRVIPAGLSAIPALVLAAAGLVLVPSLARLADVETATMLGWLAELRRPPGEGRVPDAEGREALAMYVAGRYGTQLRDERFWSGAVMQNMPPLLHESAREVLARHPSVEPGELARVSALLAPQIREAEAHYRGQAPELVRGATIMVITLTAAALALTLVCSLLSSLAVPGGVVLRLLGLAVVDAGGEEIGRARSALRALVAWLPVIAWLVYLAAAPRIQGWVPDPGSPVLSLAIMAGVTSGGIAWLLAHPNRGFHDRITRTWVVGR